VGVAFSCLRPLFMVASFHSNRMNPIMLTLHTPKKTTSLPPSEELHVKLSGHLSRVTQTNLYIEIYKQKGPFFKDLR
jgi:hypothetical protein